MLLLATILVGTWFASSFTTSIFIAIAIGSISYYFLHLIPHWDINEIDNKFIDVLRFFDFISSGIFMAFLFLPLFQINQILEFSINGLSIEFTYIHLAGAIGAAFIFFINYLGRTRDFKNVILSKFLEFGAKIKYQDKSIWGIAVQLAVIIVALTSLFRLINFPSWQMILEQLLK